MQKLTERQADVLEFICDYSGEHGYPPTLRQISDALGLKSTRSTAQHIEQLKRKGAITQTPNQARSIRVTNGVQRYG